MAADLFFSFDLRTCCSFRKASFCVLKIIQPGFDRSGLLSADGCAGAGGSDLMCGCGAGRRYLYFEQRRPCYTGGWRKLGCEKGLFLSD